MNKTPLIKREASKAIHRFDNAKRRRPENHARQAMLTPNYLLEPVRDLLGGIDLDPCTDPDNPTKATQFYHLPDDGCVLPWNAKNVFCNPPYGEARDRWVKKCIIEGSVEKPVLLLIPAHTDTRTFQKAIEACTSVLFVRGRLKFGVLRENRQQEAASHGSALIAFGIDLEPLSKLGKVFKGRPEGTTFLEWLEPKSAEDKTSQSLLIQRPQMPVFGDE